MFFALTYYLPCSINKLIDVWRLHTKHGTDWASIGAELGRSASSVKDRYRLMKETCNSGLSSIHFVRWRLCVPLYSYKLL